MGLFITHTEYTILNVSSAAIYITHTEYTILNVSSAAIYITRTEYTILNVRVLLYISHTQSTQFLM